MVVRYVVVRYLVVRYVVVRYVVVRYVVDRCVVVRDVVVRGTMVLVAASEKEMTGRELEPQGALLTSPSSFFVLL